MGLVTDLIKQRNAQEALDRIYNYRLNISPDLLKKIKEKGQLEVGSLNENCIYLLKYDKETDKVTSEVARHDIRSTAYMAGWDYENLIRSMCGIVSEEDILVAERKPEDEIARLEKEFQSEERKAKIKAWIVGLAMGSVYAFGLGSCISYFVK